MTAPGVMEARDVPMPAPGEDDVLIRMQALGICGSDLHTFRTGMAGDCAVDYPFVLGHEAAGVVEAVGERVRHLHQGDRVVMEPGVPCGRCEFCLKGLYHLCPGLRFWAAPPHDGCLMRYVVHPASFTFPLPDSVSLREGALAEPLAVGLSAAEKGDIRLGETVVILGAGCIGLMTLLAARARGAGQVILTDVLPNRLAMARQLGGTALNAADGDVVEKILALTQGRGAEVVVDCCGRTQTVQQSLRIARPHGRIVLVGLAEATVQALSMSLLIDKELTLAAVRRYHNQFPTAIRLIADGKADVKALISHEYSFEEAPLAFADCLEHPAKVIKGIIVYDRKGETQDATATF